MEKIDNTVQYSWLLEIAREFHGFEGDRIDRETIDGLYDRAERKTEQAGRDWDDEVWKRTNLEAVFLTNDFDDPLEGWDTSKFVPCLRTDDLVLKLHEAANFGEAGEGDERGRSGFAASLRLAIGALFGYFL